MKTMSLRQRRPRTETEHLKVVDLMDSCALAGTRRLECSEGPWDRGAVKFNPSFRWVLDPLHYVLVLGDPDSGHWVYEVDLERCTTSAEALDWIVQVSTKLWASARVMCGLIQALNAVLHLQSNLCGCGNECGPIDVKALVSRYVSDNATEERRKADERKDAQD